MTAPVLAELRRRLRAADRVLLRALADRARFPREPGPAWSPPDLRLPPPPLAEILYALCPAGAGDPEAAAPANRELAAALAARQRLAAEIADAKAAGHPDDFRAALEIGDRERLRDLLTDLSAELQVLDFIRTAAAELAPGWPSDLAPFLWRECLIPWTKQSEVDHLAAP